jgi:cytoplasmic FMR1 interacting protein
MKDLKASLRSDFSRYKRAVGTNLSNDELEDMKNLQEFLSSLDPRKSRNAIILTLRERLLTIRGCEGILTELLDVALDKFESDTALLLPDERFGFLRAAAHLMLLVDGDPADPKSLNVFSSKWSRQPVVLKLFKRFPVVPLYADMTITLLYILDRAPHFNRETMCETWGGAGAGIMSNIFQAAQGISAPTGAAGPTATNASGPYSTATGLAGLATSAAASAAGVRVPADYDLCAQWPGLRQSFTQYTVLLAGAINHAEAHPYRKFLDGARVQQASNLFAVLVKGLSLLSSWTSTVQLALAWKYTHPSARRVTSSTFAATTATTATAAAIPPPLQAVGESSSVRASAAAPDGAEYEQVLRNNFSREELAIFADIISMIKSTARLLARAEPLMAAYVRFYMHHRIQQVGRYIAGY